MTGIWYVITETRLGKYLLVGLTLSFALLPVLLKKNKTGNLNIQDCKRGYGICVLIHFLMLAGTLSVPFIFVYLYVVIFLPYMFFSFMLNTKLLKQAKPRKLFVNVIYKTTITLVIWFVSLFPFSLIALNSIKNIPAQNAYKNEITMLQNEIKTYETYADLTSLGLGHYKLQHEGAPHLWDITKPEKTVITYDGVMMVYEHLFNRNDEESWDNAWNNSNVGKDVEYDVFFYEGTYLIVTPLWDKPGVLYYRGYIYICKELSPNCDLFDIGITDLQMIEKILQLPGEKMSRAELSELLGKVA